jgi:predicted outer membrane repeat protein
MMRAPSRPRGKQRCPTVWTWWARKPFTRTVAAVGEFLGGPLPNGDGWDFDFGEQVESNRGAVFGGAIAAGLVSVARCSVPDRSPRSLHVQLVRSLPTGVAHALAEVRHSGPTLAA